MLHHNCINKTDKAKNCYFVNFPVADLEQTDLAQQFYYGVFWISDFDF